MNSSFLERVHGFFNNRSVSTSVELRVKKGRGAHLNLQPVLYRRKFKLQKREKRTLRFQPNKNSLTSKK
jgi:hypothetical protein